MHSLNAHNDRVKTIFYAVFLLLQTLIFLLDLNTKLPKIYLGWPAGEPRLRHARSRLSPSQIFNFSRI